MEESRLEKRLVEKVKLMGGVCVKFIPARRAGTPDRIAFLPGGRVYLIELKAKRGNLSELQKARIKEYERLGFKVMVIYDETGLTAALEAMRVGV
jgi:hypothetical protein